MFSFGKYTLKYQDPVNVANVSIFLQKITIFVKIVPLLKAIVRELC